MVTAVEVEKGTVEDDASLKVRRVASGKGTRDVLWAALSRRILMGSPECLSSVGPLWDWLDSLYIGTRLGEVHSFQVGHLGS